jgi:hypothetical protein
MPSTPEIPKRKSPPTHRQASQSRRDRPGSRVLVQPRQRESARQKLKARQPAPVSGIQTRLVNRVLRPRSDADPPPFLERPPPMLLLLEIRQPLDHRRDPARS